MSEEKLNLKDIESKEESSLIKEDKNEFNELHHIIPNNTGKVEKIIKNSYELNNEAPASNKKDDKNDSNANIPNVLKKNKVNNYSNTNNSNSNLNNTYNVPVRGGRRVSYKFLPLYDALKTLNIDGQNSRCSECLFIPFLSVKNVNGKAIVESICRNGHKQEKEIKEFMENSQSSIFTKIKCVYCNQKITKDNIPFKFCFNENGFVCNNCTENHKMHNIVNLNNYDSFCLEAKGNFGGYCLTEKKNYSLKTGDKRTHDNFEFEEVLINPNSLQNLIKKLAIAKKQLGDIDNIKNSIINNLQNTINEIERTFKIYKENNLNVISLFEDIIETYKNRLNEKNFSFEIIKNVKNCLKFNYVEFKPANKNDLNESINFLNFLKNSSNNIFEPTKINYTKDDDEEVDKNILKSLAKDPLIEKRNMSYIPEKESNNYIGNILLLKNNKLLCFVRKKEEYFFRIYEKNLKDYYEIPVDINVSNYYMTQLNDEQLILINEKKILLIKLNEKDIKVNQELKSHESSVKKVIQLKNGNIVSCDEGGAIKFWNLINNKDYACFNTISAFDGAIQSMLEIPFTNEIVCTCENLAQFKYYSLSNMENTCIYSDIKCNNYREKLILITEKILAAAGNKFIYLFDVVNYKKIQKISCYCDVIKIEKLRDNSILTFGKNGDTYYFEQWVIYRNKIKSISKYKIEEKYGQIEYFTLNANKNIILCNYNSNNDFSYLFEFK